MQYHKVPQAFWLYTSACLFYTHPPTPGFLARHHAHHKPQQYWQAGGCIHLAVYKCVLILHPPANPRLFGQTPRTPQTTTVLAGWWLYTFGCLQMRAYFTPTRQPQAFWPDTTNHNRIGRLVAVYIWLFTNACLFYTHPPTPCFLARHHTPQTTTVLAGLWLYTFGCLQMRAYFTPTRQSPAFWPDTTHHKSQQYWEACGCIQMRAYFTPTNPRLFGQTPRTTVYYSVGRFLHPDFSPDTTHHGYNSMG